MENEKIITTETDTTIAGALFLNISKLFTTQSGFIHTVALLHQTNMKRSFSIENLQSAIKRQLKSQFRLGYLLTEEQIFIIKPLKILC